MQYRAFQSDIEVNGKTIWAVIDGLDAHKAKGLEYLEKCGIANIYPDSDDWYAQQAWLDAFKLIDENIGGEALYSIGTKIPNNALLPSGIQNIHQALGAINIAYHKNHRNAEEQVLYQPKLGEENCFLEGIGYYKVQQDVDMNQLIMECNNPYPCDFDMGIITAFGRIFSPEVIVEHVKNTPCRKDGKSDACTYRVRWKNPLSNK